MGGQEKEEWHRLAMLISDQRQTAKSTRGARWRHAGARARGMRHLRLGIYSLLTVFFPWFLRIILYVLGHDKRHRSAGVTSYRVRTPFLSCVNARVAGRERDTVVVSM